MCSFATIVLTQENFYYNILINEQTFLNYFKDESNQEINIIAKIYKNKQKYLSNFCHVKLHGFRNLIVSKIRLRKVLREKFLCAKFWTWYSSVIYPMLGLTCSDLMFLTLCVPFTAIDYAFPVWVLPTWTCNMINYLQVFSRQFS